MALNEKSGDHQSYYSSSWGEHECVKQLTNTAYNQVCV